MDELFIGNALCEVTSGGEIMLPKFFTETARHRSTEQALFIGLHETARCLVAFDRQYTVQREFDYEPQRLQDDPQRLRRAYGFVEQTAIAPDGMIALPPLMRERGHIGDWALLVATGQRFEIWDLEGILKNGPSDLLLLATHHRLTHIAKEVLNVPALSSGDACRGADCSTQSRICIQSLPAVQPRHDAIGRRVAGWPLAAGTDGISRAA